MRSEVLDRVVVAAQEMEVVTVDLHVTAHYEVAGGDELVLFVYILVLLPLQEWSFDNSGVLLGRLEDRDGVVSHVE